MRPYFALVSSCLPSTWITFTLALSMAALKCHAPIPGPTRLADPNLFPGRETQDWDSLPDFFFKTDLVLVGMAHIL